MGRVTISTTSALSPFAAIKQLQLQVSIWTAVPTKPGDSNPDEPWSDSMTTVWDESVTKAKCKTDESEGKSIKFSCFLFPHRSEMWITVTAPLVTSNSNLDIRSR